MKMASLTFRLLAAVLFVQQQSTVGLQQERTPNWVVKKFGKDESNYKIIDRYTVHTDSKLVKIPPTDAEEASVDAINAWHSAEQAKQAAEVVHKVVRHTEDIREKAANALHKAKGVLKEARVASDDHLVDDQKSMFHRAEKQLRKAAGEKQASDDARKAKLRNRLGTTPFDEGDALEAQMKALRHEVEREEIRRIQNSVVKSELEDAKKVVEELEAAEKHKGDRDELKAEIERLREHVHDLENEKLKFVPDTGSLHFELPAKKALPLRQVVVPTTPSPTQKPTPCPTAACLGMHGYGDEWR